VTSAFGDKESCRCLCAFFVRRFNNITQHFFVNLFVWRTYCPFGFISKRIPELSGTLPIDAVKLFAS
jgi:hypothetical protein